MEERKAFSFYRSYYEASKDLPTKEDQADFLMAICSYIFDGVEPEIQGVASAMFKLAKPNLDTSVKRANAGQIGGSNNKKQNKTKANEKQNESKIEANEKQNESQAEAINDYMINDYMINDKKEEVEEEKTPQKYQPILEAWNNLPVTNIRIISGKRLQMLKSRIKQYSFDDVLKAIQTIHNSPFLLGDNKRKWQITFDWFILPNNFPKVLEGNYLPKEEPAPAENKFDKVIADNQNKQGEDILFMDIVRAYKDAKANGETRTLQEYAEEYRQRKRGELNGVGNTKGVV